MNKDKLLELVDVYAGMSSMYDQEVNYGPLTEGRKAREALIEAINAADREKQGFTDAVSDRDSIIKQLLTENAALRQDAERYRAFRKATITEDDAFLDELDNYKAPKTDAEFDAIFNAASAALEKS